MIFLNLVTGLYENVGNTCKTSSVKKTRCLPLALGQSITEYNLYVYLYRCI